MLNTVERVRQVQERVKDLERRRANWLLGGLGSLSVVLVFTLIAIIGSLSGGMQACAIPGFYGSLFLSTNAGGYVLAGVLAFAAGVLVTVLCLRYRRRSEK